MDEVIRLSLNAGSRCIWVEQVDAMPEAAMYEDYCSAFREDQVRATGKPPTMGTESEPETMHGATKRELGLGVPATVPRHPLQTLSF